MSMKCKRRGFLKTGALAGVIGGTGAGLPWQNAAAAGNEVVVVVFLRGGADGLHIVPPLGGPDRGHYETYRPNLRLPTGGSGAALPLGTLGGTEFGLHPAAQPLAELYRDGLLAVVQATGLPPAQASRSHFDAMAYTELGTPGRLGTSSGWLARLVNAVTPAAENTVPAAAVANASPQSLQGSRSTLTLTDLNAFDLGYGHWLWDGTNPDRLPLVSRDDTLRALYSDSGTTAAAGRQALAAIDIVSGWALGQSSRYPDNELGKRLRTAANLIKADFGLRALAVDHGGWDTHVYQNGNNFSEYLLSPLARGLAAFINDLDTSGDSRRVTVIVQSEFGRRAYENGDRGTDHGSGNSMLLLGRTVNGGRLYGDWPGLAPEQLYEGEDVAVTTDCRHVIGEVLTQRFGSAGLSDVFPGFSASGSLGIVKSVT